MNSAEPLKTKPVIQNPLNGLSINTAVLKKIILKLVVILGVLLISIIAILIFLYFTKLDRSIFPITITGKVIDAITEQGISNATVTINNENYSTALDGSFTIQGYFKDDIKLSANIQDYQSLNEEITLVRNFLVLNFNAELKLMPEKSGILTGQFIAETNHNFAEDKLFINSNEVKLNVNGTFTASNLPKGEILFEFKSLVYKDIEKLIEIKEGFNNLEAINLEQSGDIKGRFFDWLNESTPIKASIEATNVSSKQISVQDDGFFTIKDLEIGFTYNLRISHSDYLTRDYSVTIGFGENQIFGLKMIPKDITPAYLKTGVSKLQFYKSDLDGLNEEKLTSINNFKPSAIFYDNKTIFFRDDFETIKGIGSGSIAMGYSIDLNTKTLNRLTSNSNQLQSFYYNYFAGKLINILTTKVNKSNQVKIEVRDIDGSNPKTINEGIDLVITNLIISNQQSKVFYTLRKPDSKIDDLYTWNPETELSKLLVTDEDIQFYDVSPSGQRLLFTRKNSQTGFEDLVSLDVESLSTKVILQNHDGQFYKFEQDSSDLFYFVATRDGRNNLYLYNLKDNSTRRITFLDLKDSINDFYIIDRYIFYVVNSNLYVLDKNIPLNYKLVTGGISVN